MTGSTNKGRARWRLPLLLAGLVLAVLAWAAIDGGREPVRLIEQPVALPPLEASARPADAR